MSWPTVKIGDFCQLMTGGTPSTSIAEYYENGTVPWIVSGDIHKKEIYDCEKKITELAVKNSNARYLPKDSVLIALNGQGKTRGTVALLRAEGATCNQSIVSINPNDKEELFSDYLFYYLKSQYQQIRNITGDKDRAGLNMPIIRDIKIPLPPLEEQKRIAAILDKADAIRRKRQQAIKLADEFLRAVFLEMFGDPVTNPKNWSVKPISELCTIVRGSSPRPQGDPKYYGGPIPRLMVADLTRDGKWVEPKIDSLTLEGAKKSRPINAGTVVMAVSGNVGLTAILEIDACIHDGFIAFNNLKTESVEPEFLYEVMMFLKSTHASRQAGAIFQNITTTQIKEMLIPLPGIDLQKAYLHSVRLLKVFKEKQQKFLVKDNDLFCSLSNNAFSGNLN